MHLSLRASPLGQLVRLHNIRVTDVSRDNSMLISGVISVFNGVQGGLHVSCHISLQDGVHRQILSDQ